MERLLAGLVGRFWLSFSRRIAPVGTMAWLLAFLLPQVLALNVAAAQTPDTQPPTQPTGLQATATQTSITLYWLPSSDNVGVVSHTIYQCAAVETDPSCDFPAAVITAGGTQSQISLTGLTPGTAYRLRIRARDAAGNWSLYSGVYPISTQVIDTLPPTEPTNLVAVPQSTTQINLTWTPALDQSFGITYYIERCQGTGCADFSERMAGYIPTSFADADLQPQTTYRYRVRARDAVLLFGAYSAIVTAITLTPDTESPTVATALTATAQSPSTIAVQWGGATDNVAVARYSLESCQGTGCSNFVEVFNGNGASFLHSSLQELTSYSYRVRAFDTSENVSAYSTVVSATTPEIPDTQPPSAPGSLTVAAQSTSQVNVNWSAAADDRVVTNYLVERCAGNACSGFQQIVVTNTQSYTDNNVTARRIYRYRVRAVDAANNLGPFSAIAQVMTPDLPTPTPTPPPPSNPTVTSYYNYDELGRLSQATRSDGSVTIYSYDANGNATHTYRSSAGALGIGRLQPSSGPVGVTVKIYGSGFSTTASANTVQFAGVAAVVSSATGTLLTVTVPVGAATGPVSVTIGGVVRQSPTPFVVRVPMIRSFTPPVVNTGATVTVDGMDFDLSSQPETITIGSTAATIQSLTNTRATIGVPATAASGPISIQTSYGTSTTPTPLIVLPSGITLSSVQQASVMSINQPPQALVTTQSTSYAVIAFNANAGDFLTADANALSTTPANSTVVYQLYSPTNSIVATGSFTSASRSAHLPKLISSGTYLLLLRNNSGGLQASVSISRNVELQSSGVSLAVAASFPAQAKRFTFNGMSGQNFGLALTASTLSPSGGYIHVQVFKPDNAVLTSSVCYSTVSPGCQLTVRNLPMVGTYTVTVTPSSAATLNTNISLSQSVGGALTPNTPLSVSLAVPGQNASLTFVATAGQTFALNAASIASAPANKTTTVTVYNTSGTQIATTSGNTNNVTANLPNLTAGTYSVLITSSDAATASMQVTLASGLAATLTANGTTVPYATTVKGQLGYFTLSGTAGQNLGLAMTALSFSPSGDYATIQVFRPNGSWLTSINCAPTTVPGCQLSLRNLPTTGAYSMIVTPSTAATMSFALTLSQNITGTLAPNMPQTVNLSVPGQNALLTFTATAGQTFALNATSIVSAPTGKTMLLTVYNAAGAQVASSSGNSSNVTVNMPNMAAGTYAVLITGNVAVTATMEVTLASGLVGSLPTNGATTAYASTVKGQVGYFTFSGIAGQNLGLAFTSISLSPSGGYIYFELFKPDGSLMNAAACSEANIPGCQLSLRNLPTTGPYSLRATPSTASTASFSLTLSQNVTGSLMLNTPQSISLAVPGQNALLTFAATAGQTIVLTMSSAVTTPAGKATNIIVYGPNGQQFTSGSGTTNATSNLPSLSAGSYSVLVAPQYAATAAMQIAIQ